MDLPDCPPGAEGYHDSVTEVPKKPELEEPVCTKAELEFQEHLNSLKIKLEDGTIRCMVEKRGRDVSSNWIYLCYPCAAVCSGESILQTHISGKKHKTKLSAKNFWPASIFDEHPYILREKGGVKSGATEKINQKMAEEVMLYNNSPSELDLRFNKYKNIPCHIQETLDAVKAPLLGVEYLIEHPPEQAHYEPSYLCTLCTKQGHPRTIVNHLTCYWHRWNYLARHFPKASGILVPYRHRTKFRDGVQIVMNRLAQRIDDKFGRFKPLNIDKEEYEKEKDLIFQWIYKSNHITEELGHTFEEVVDEDLINSLSQTDDDGKTGERNPSPPVVPAHSRPQFNNHSRPPGRQERRHMSTESLSDVSEDEMQRPADPARVHARPNFRGKYDPLHKPSFEQYPEKQTSAFRSRYVIRNVAEKDDKPAKAINHDYKIKLAEDKKQVAIEAAKKTLAYHEKYPEKHPLYPEEWKMFWNRRYKEIQAEGKDPSKHDFKPEWISFWTARMKELHDEELRVNVTELYRKMGLPSPDFKSEEENPTPPIRPRSRSATRRPDYRKRSPDYRKRSPDLRKRSPEYRKRSPDPRRRMPQSRRRSPDPRRRSPDSRRRSPDFRKRSPDPAHRRLSPMKRRSPMPRRKSPDYRRPPPDYRRDRRSPGYRDSPPRRRTPDRRRSPGYKRSVSPGHRTGSPLSQRAAHRNRTRSRSRSPHTAPSMQTVLISDDELKPDDGLSPWNSDNDMDSIGSKNELPSRGGSVASRASRPRPRASSRGPTPHDFGPADNVVATLRLLVALEDYLGSLGPKIVDLLTEALKMEKEKANSSEELLAIEGVVALLETAKEKLKGAVQAGLVGGGVGAAVRAAVVRVAVTLHDAEAKAKRSQSKKPVESKGAVAVAGVGEVDREEIAAQMAAALVAEGRTDVSPEELANLVDAVVGMAEAKKREAHARKQAEVKSVIRPETPQAQPKANPASALQMLQSAYDDGGVTQPNQDAMDGLSDSDLETLLRNFNELSAEEQHSLIAYLKKLEVGEPQRVERLRRFVSAAANTNPLPSDQHLTAIESDDDDYTVEEVFKSVTQKVKENQMQQEMEIVKKSIEESKASEVITEQHTVDHTAMITQNMSSAADLLALVQASIQSTSQCIPASNTHLVDYVVTSNNQPRSFGDMPEPPAMGTDPTKQMTNLINSSVLNQSSREHQEGFSQSQNQMNFGGNGNQRETYGQNVRSNVRESLLPDLRQQSMMDRQPLIRDQAQSYKNRQYSYNRQPTMSEDNKQPLLSDNRPPLIGDQRQALLGDNRPPLINDNRQTSMNDNRQSLMSDNRQPLMGDHRQPSLGDNRQTFYNDNRPPLIGDDRQSSVGDHRPPPLLGDVRPSLLNDNRQPLTCDNRQPLIGDSRQTLMGDHRQPLIGDRQPLMGDNRQFLVGDRKPLMGDNRQPSMGDRQPLMGDKQTLMGDNRQPLMGDRQPLISDNRQLSMGDRQPLMSDNRQPLIGERQPLMGDKRQPLIGERQPLMGDKRQPLIGDRQPSMGDRQPLMGDNRQPLMGDRQPLMGDRPPLMGDTRQSSMGDRQSLMGDNRQPLMGDDRQPLMGDNRQPLVGGDRNSDTRQPLITDEMEPMRSAINTFNQNTFSDDARSNYGQMEDSFNSNNEMDQQRFSNYNNKMNFRGRGRGQSGGGVRGRRSRGRGR